MSNQTQLSKATIGLTDSQAGNGAKVFLSSAKAEYTQRAGERGKLLQQCKSEKQDLERELLQIKQLDLFVNL